MDRDRPAILRTITANTSKPIKAVNATKSISPKAACSIFSSVSVANTRTGVPILKTSDVANAVSMGFQTWSKRIQQTHQTAPVR